MPVVKSLTEYSMRAIMANVDAVDSLGTLPYRLAKPILTLMTPEKLMEIERNSPHLKEDDQEIWESLCVRRFNLRLDNDEFKSPKSWRKFYHTEIVRLKQLEDDAGERARNRYKAATAEKQVRSLVFNPVATPMNRPGIKTWGRGAAPPKTLFDKARSDTKRKQSYVYTASSKPMVPTPSATASAALLVQTPTRAISVTTTVVSRTPSSHSGSTSMSPPPAVIGIKRPLPRDSSPPSPARPSANAFSSSPPPLDTGEYPMSPPPSMSLSHHASTKRPRGGVDALFMPKHAANPRTLPSRAR